MEATEQLTVVCRKAAPEDVETLYELIKGYAEQGIMLPRTRETLLRQIDTFVVAEIGDKVVGCGSLLRLGQDLVEIRSLGMSQEYRGLKIGNKLVDFLVEQAREQQIPKIMALTYAVNFFLRNGFTVVEKEIFPEKVWKDCVNCPKQHACDEIAVLKMLNE
ncbi:MULTISPECIES: N-acetyltransferase [Paenibacillus]|uniref:Acetyltransferase n=1 Tax=Paenibacillus glycanilyticus TaxID=126569 RepID=A0ABQ6NNK6_9BACL|nr:MULTISPECIES: N-acetyltransferase [Paenibacillus]MCK9857208.1 N-acetyltransferase [Paenibacillus sp. ATY16]GMK45569.1 acetyltransferase [Paenibacillus glycanilyticus]